ncbi:uncharacterized protein LOC143956189 [Lithobates pipiens]
MDHMITLKRMEEDPSHMTERILNLTLEIIYLLTGKSFPPVKFGDKLTITVPSYHSLNPKRDRGKKIVQLANKIIDLLTGEVPTRCQDVIDSEEEHLEGHKDLYKDVMMENQPPLTSPDGSSNGNPPQRCPRPLYSRDSTQEDHTISHKLKKKIKNENGGVNVKERLPGHKAPFKGIVMERFSDPNPPERCPHPQYSQNSALEDHTIPHRHQDEVRINIKVEVKEEEEESYVEGDQPSMEDIEIIMKSEEDEISLPIDTVQRCQDVTVYFSMEEWEYLEGHKDLYKDVMMDNQPPLTSPDGSSNENPQERCPRPLYSRDSSMENHTSLHKVKKEVKEEEDEVGVMEFSEGHRDPFKHIMLEPFSDTNPPERCPPPLYSRDSTQEDHTIPHHHQGEEQINIKAEVKEEEEETYVVGDKPSMEEVGMIQKSEQEEISLPIHTNGCDVRNSSERRLLLSADCKSEDNVITQDPPGGNPNTQNIHHRLSCPETSMDPSDQGESSHQSHTMIGNIHVRSHTADPSTDPSNPEETSSPHEGDHQGENLLSCLGCGKSFQTKSELRIHLRSHTRVTLTCSYCEKSFNEESEFRTHQRLHKAETPHICSACGKRFTEKNELLVHQKVHIGVRPFSCSECGKCFTGERQLLKHQRLHSGERPFTCSECGKCFTQKRTLVEHRRIHTGERPYSCSECGKGFNHKGDLVKHQKTHTGERPYSCSECGKCFVVKCVLLAHQRVHTGERPFSCTECGKSFTQKGSLTIHQRLHKIEQPFPCLECGRSFNVKAKLLAHQRHHIKESLVSCSDCGKSFGQKAQLLAHQKSHTGKHPFPCPVCGIYFSDKGNLNRHQISHTSERPFACSECGKSFTRNANLIKHQRKHT